MPQRPNDPQDGTALINEVLARLRALERTRPSLPDSADPLQTFENGSPLGDTRFLDFGPGVTATLIGDDYVQVVGGGGVVSSWDAILDSSIAATDTTVTPPIFKTNVREVLVYLESLGYTRANIFVRPGTYTETALFSPTAISTAILFSGQDHDDQCIWDHAGFAMGNLNYHLHGIHAKSGAKATFFQASIYAYRCRFSTSGMLSAFTFTAGDSEIIDSIFIGGAMNFGARTTLVACEISTGSRSVTLASTWILMVDCVIGVAGTATWTLPSRAYISIHNDTALQAGTFDSGTVTISGAIAGARYFLESKGQSGRISVLISSTPAAVEIVGKWQSITTPAQQNPFTLGSVPTRIDASVDDDLDITGPANINIRQNGNQNVLTRFRGRGIVGSISRWDNGSSGAMLEFIDADQCQIDVAGDGTSASGTRSPYSFDASSANNVLVFAGRTTFPAAGTDAGTNNRVLPEGSTPPAGGIAPADADYLVGTANAGLSAEIVVGTTPGGELGGTWASPTVDTTHSGSAHSDFVPVAGHVNGHVIEDEGTPLTQRANVNFVGAGVTVTDDTPDTKVTIPGVGTPTAGWGSITNVTTDRVYDANATTIDELADVLGSLIADLIAQGVIAT